MNETFVYIFGGLNAIFLVLNGIISIHLKKSTTQEDIAIEADRVTDRLIQLQEAELKALHTYIGSLERTLADRDTTIDKQSGEITNLRGQISVLKEAIFSGTKDYRIAIANRISRVDESVRLQEEAGLDDLVLERNKDAAENATNDTHIG